MKHTVRVWVRVLGVCVLVAFSGSGSALFAQRGADTDSQDRAALEQRFRRQMDRMLKERLDLTDGGLEELKNVMGPFDSRRRELGREERAIRRETEEYLVNGGTDLEVARGFLTRLSDLRLQEIALVQEEQEALLELLTPTQLLKLHSFREQMGDRIRQLRGRRDDDGRRRRGGAGGGRPG